MSQTRKVNQRDFSILCCAALTAAVACSLVSLFPFLEVVVLSRGAAELAGLLSGAPVIAQSGGWLLPLAGQPLLVTTACSGAGFYLLVSLILAVQSRGMGHAIWFSVPASMLLALPLAVFINGLRLLCLAQAHLWVIPQLPHAYFDFAHMVVGVAVFLPALIGLNIALEIYGNRKAPEPR